MNASLGSLNWFEIFMWGKKLSNFLFSFLLVVVAVEFSPLRIRDIFDEIECWHSELFF